MTERKPRPPRKTISNASTKRGPGRPQHERSEAVARRVTSMVAVGLSVGDVARLEQLSAPTLRKHYRQELDTGAMRANAEVAMRLYRATANDWKAAAFWLRVRAGWVEQQPQPREELPGKKASAEILSRVVDKGTSWDGLLAGSAVQ